MRLIDADELEKYMCNIRNTYYSDEPCEPSDCVFRNAIQNAPTIEATPVVHGRWDEECRCTVCGWYGEDWYKRDVYYFDYCPNCSAKMDGGVSDG